MFWESGPGGWLSPPCNNRARLVSDLTYSFSILFYYSTFVNCSSKIAYGILDYHRRERSWRKLVADHLIIKTKKMQLLFNIIKNQIIFKVYFFSFCWKTWVSIFSIKWNFTTIQPKHHRKAAYKTHALRDVNFAEKYFLLGHIVILKRMIKRSTW